MPIDSTLRDALGAVTTASLARALHRRGLGGMLAGVLPRAGAGVRIVGEAFTLRLIPERADAAPGPSARIEAAVEVIPEGGVAIAAAGGCGAGAAVLGEILAARLSKRGVAALVTDGGVETVGALPVWAAALAGPMGGALTLAGSAVPIALGGAAVHPGDIVVADADGVVVIPPGIAEAVALEAVERQRLDLWILREIERGAGLSGLSPPSPETLARYEAETATPRSGQD